MIGAILTKFGRAPTTWRTRGIPRDGYHGAVVPRWPSRDTTVTWPFRETRRFSPAFIVNVTVPWSNRTETVNAPAYGRAHEQRVLVLREEARPAVDDPRVGDAGRRRGHDPDDAAVLVVLAVIADHLHDQRLRPACVVVLRAYWSPPTPRRPMSSAPSPSKSPNAMTSPPPSSRLVAGFSMKTPPPVLSRMRVVRQAPRGQDHVLESIAVEVGDVGPVAAVVDVRPAAATGRSRRRCRATAAVLRSDGAAAGRAARRCRRRRTSGPRRSAPAGRARPGDRRSAGHRRRRPG